MLVFKCKSHSLACCVNDERCLLSWVAFPVANDWQLAVEWKQLRVQDLQFWRVLRFSFSEDKAEPECISKVKR